MFRNRRLNENADADCTPLHIAIFKGWSLPASHQKLVTVLCMVSKLFLIGNTDVARKLIENGADIHARDKFSLTPLMLAAAKDNLIVAQDLEEKGAKYHVSLSIEHLLHVHRASASNSPVSRICHHIFVELCKY